ncbi:MAG: LexA family transcriptional regulator [Fimbriimonas sp.]
MNLRRLRRAKELTQHQLDDAIGVPRGRTSNYESGKALPTDEYLEAAILPLGLRDVSIFRRRLEEDLKLPLPGDQPPVLVPYWGVVPCGGWERPSHDPDMVPVSAAFRDRTDIIAVKATGESMMPLYKPGQIVPIRINQRKLEGTISLIQNEDQELSLKVARRFPDGHWEFHSINPLYGQSKGEEIRLLGHAVHIPEVLDLEGIRL